MNVVKRLAVVTFAWYFFMFAVANTIQFTDMFLSGNPDSIVKTGGWLAFAHPLLVALFWAVWWILKDWKPNSNQKEKDD